MKTTKEKITNMGKAAQRESRKSQGFFDGRFKNRMIPNKKKEMQFKNFDNE